MHPEDNTMRLPISRFVSHDYTDGNDAAAPHCGRESHAFIPSPPSPDHVADHGTPEPLVVNTLKDDPAGSVSSGSGGGGSAAGGTGGGGTGTNGRAACANADDDSVLGVSLRNSGGGEASNSPPLGPDSRNGGAGVVGEAVGKVATIASPIMEMYDDEVDGSLPSTGGEDWVGSGTGSGGAETNPPPRKGLADHYGGSAGDASHDLDNTVPPSGMPERRTRVPENGNEEDNELGTLPSGAGGGDSVGTGTGGGEEGNNYNEGAAADMGLVAADHPRGNAAGDGHDIATRPPAGGNGGGSPRGGKYHTYGKSPAGGKPVTDNRGKPAEGETGRTHVGGMEDLTAIGGDDEDVTPPLSSDAAGEDESMGTPFARKLPDGDDSAGGVSNGGGGGGSAGGGTGGGGAGTNGCMSGSYGNEMFVPIAVASTGWVLTAVHVALLQGVALRAKRATLEAGVAPTVLWG